MRPIWIDRDFPDESNEAIHDFQICFWQLRGAVCYLAPYNIVTAKEAPPPAVGEDEPLTIREIRI
jgi:hypothetical protein